MSAPPQVGTVYATPISPTRYGALQVVAARDGAIRLVALDWTGQSPPSVEDLGSLRPLIQTHHRHRDTQMHRTTDAITPPPGFVMVGVAPPVVREGDSAAVNYYHRARKVSVGGAWYECAGAADAQWRWDHVVPDSAKQAYRHASKTSGEKVTLLIDGRQQTQSAGMTSLAIGGEGADLVCTADAKLDWQVLDAFGALGKLSYSGSDAGLLKYLARRPLINEVYWSGHRQNRMDFSECPTQEVGIELDRDRALQVILGPHQRELVLDGDYEPDRLTIEHPEAGRGLRLRLRRPTRGTPPPLAGIRHIEALTVFNSPKVKLAEVAVYDNLRWLRLHFCASIVDIEVLASFRNLRGIEILDCFEFDADAFPLASTWPDLEYITLRNLRRTSAAIVKRRLKGAPWLDISGAKSDAWLAANVDNPFRDWVEDDKKLGTKACAIYKKSVTALRKADSASAQRAALDAFVVQFNHLDDKLHLDTPLREEIGEAYLKLTQFASPPIAEGVAETWFNEARTF